MEGKARPILSRQTSELLAILKIEINSISEENLLREFEGSFVGVGKLRDFQAKLHVDESVQPIAQKLRATPFGLRWLETVSSTFQDVAFDGSLLPLFIS